MMISLQLINQLDAIWHSGFGGAGGWERSIGRYLWPYLDELRFGMLTDPFCNVTSIIIFILGNIVVLECFKLEPNKFASYAFSLLFLISTSVCAWLSFRYMSNTFAVAYLMSVLAICVCYKLPKCRQLNECKLLGENNKVVNILTVIIGAICIMASLALYQAFINCSSMLILTIVMVALLRDDELKDIITFVVRSIVTIALGVAFYFIGLKICYAVYDLDMNSYNSGSSLSIGNLIISIPSSFKRTLYYFDKYFFDIMFRWNRLQEHSVFRILLFGLLIVSCVIALIKIWKKSKVNAIIFAICALLLPVATNTALFMATESYLSIQMTCGLAFFVAICMVIVFEVFEAVDWNKIVGDKKAPKKIVNVAITAFCILIIYGNYISVQIDQEACREGRTGTITIAGEVLETLLEMGYADVGGTVCFVGMPCGNERFMYSEIYPTANNLMQFGNWGTTASSHKQTWEGIYREYFGYYIQACDEADFDRIIKRDDVSYMPDFPRPGSLMKLDDITVVKISNIY